MQLIVRNNKLPLHYWSFISTDAVVPPDLNRITFGVPQTLKALYIWNGQLDPVYAVSLIKGILNVVPDDPIQANSYSFVYNDPDDTGNVMLLYLTSLLQLL